MILGDASNSITRGRLAGPRRAAPWELVQTEEFNTRAEAMAREKALKSGTLIKHSERGFGRAAAVNRPSGEGFVVRVHVGEPTNDLFCCRSAVHR